jgi:hypothetical protein
VIDGSLCRLCQVRISSFSQAGQREIGVHERGSQHRTRLCKWRAGRASIAELQQQAEAAGFSLEIELDGDTVTASELLVEADTPYKLSLCIDNARQTVIRSAFLTPDPDPPGLSRRQVKHWIMLPGDSAAAAGGAATGGGEVGMQGTS